MIKKEQSGSSRSNEVRDTLYVVDSYALFAYFEDEEGADIVTNLGYDRRFGHPILIRTQINADTR